MERTKAQVPTAGVIGWPVNHSKSPLIHGYWLAQHHIDGAYLPVPTPPEELAQTVKQLKEADWRGFNVTLPHKQAIMPLLDTLDATATAIGAVNTVVRLPDGRMEGRNTDAYGFIRNLEQQAGLTGIQNAVVLGAGGAARACVYGLRQLDIAVTIINRSADKAATLARDFGCAIGNWGEWNFGACDLLVNTTALGMQGKDPLHIDLATLPPTAIVYDIVYIPEMTELLTQAGARGHRIVTGLGMLLHQAVAGFSAWYGVTPNVDAALEQVVRG